MLARMTRSKPPRTAQHSAAVEATPPPRKASRDVRRQQLIGATITVLARKGYAALTIADVAREAGLSPGIVIFHFTTKDGLLAETLRFLALEYHNHWNMRIQEAGSAPAERLKALLLSDADTAVFTPERLSAWLAFWGEAQARPIYDEICSRLDAARFAKTEELVRLVNTEGGYGLSPAVVMRTLECLTDGLWLGLAATGAGQKGRVTPAEARKVVIAALSAFFPRHFPSAG